ncbi:hypothetical protein [Cognatishimia sp.]|uniref:hypothetical protein n=1 Tax=Cognatishimia sp. TaxID=2211648 RepID=UPI003512D2C8|nr:hypothetical protein [Cognatishimia sp.]
MTTFTLRQTENTPEQERLIYDRWHNTKWHYDYVKRKNGIVQTNEYVSKIVAEYKQFADDSQGKRHFLEESRIVKEFILEDLIQTLPIEQQIQVPSLIQNDYETDVFILKNVFNIDVELEVS